MPRILNIAGRLHTIAEDGVLVSASELLDESKNKKQSVVNADVDSALADRYTKSEVYTKQEVNSLVSPNQNYVTVAEFTDLPVSGATDTIYRVSSWDGSLSTPAVDVTKYSEYAWDDTDYVFLCVKTQIGEVYDISAANSGAKYDDLAEALGANGANVPVDIRRGGMSIKFVQNSDNKYVQWRYMGTDATTTATFTNVANWQGVDDVPTAGSDNLVKSGGVRRLSDDVVQSIIDCPYYDSSKYVALSSSGYTYEDNKILKNDGTTAAQQGFRVYTITHGSWSVYWRTIGVVGNFIGESGLSAGYANVEIKDGSGNLVFRGPIQGYKMIVLQKDWVLRLSINNASDFFVQNAQAFPQITPPVSAVDAWPVSSSNNPTTGNGVFNYSKLLRQGIIDSPYIDKTKFIPLSEVSSDISYEDNKLLNADGTTTSHNSFRVYTITFTNSSAYNRSKGIYALFNGFTLSNGVANFELKDNSGNLIFRERLSGEKLIIMQPNWTLRLCVEKTEEYRYLVQTTQGFQLENLNSFLDNAGNAFNKKIYGIGDSLTYEGTWLTELASLTGIPTKNLGVGGENAATILGRINSMPYKVVSDITIPASNESEVELTLNSDYGTVLPLLGSNSCRVQIAGIIGTLRTTAGSWATSATYLFKRQSSGSAVSVKAGEPVYCIGYGAGYQSKFGAVPSGQYQVLWIGQNGGFYVGSGTSITQDDADNLVVMIKRHIEMSQPQNFIVASPPQNTNAILENTLSKAFGGCFLNVRKQMMDNGIRIALENEYLVGDYPTQQDTTDIQNGLIPSSLRADAVHFNVAGCKTFARMCYENIIKNVWML